MPIRTLYPYAISALVGLMLMTNPWLSTPAASQAESALISASEAGNLAAVRQAIDTGAALESRDERGRTALLIAVQDQKPG